MNKPWRNEKYLGYVRSLSCCRCQFPGHLGSTAVHHIIGNGLVKGIGTKAADCMTMPLCSTCHAEVHADYDILNQEREALQTVTKAFKEEFIIINPSWRKK